MAAELGGTLLTAETAIPPFLFPDILGLVYSSTASHCGAEGCGPHPKFGSLTFASHLSLAGQPKYDLLWPTAADNRVPCAPAEWRKLCPAGHSRRTPASLVVLWRLAVQSRHPCSDEMEISSSAPLFTEALPRPRMMVNRGCIWHFLAQWAVVSFR